MVVAQVDHRQDYFLEGPLRYLVNVAQKKALAAEEILHKTVELRWLEDNKGLWFDEALVDGSVDSMLVDSVWVFIFGYSDGWAIIFAELVTILLYFWVGRCSNELSPQSQPKWPMKSPVTVDVK